MPIISPTAISPHRIGGKSWSSYWATRIPSEVTSSFVVDTILGKVDWTDNSGGEVSFQVYSSTNGGADVFIADVEAGIVTYNDTTCKQNASVVYKVRGVKDGNYSDFVNAIALVTPLCFKTNQSVLTNVVINNLDVAAGKSVHVDWGDGTSGDYTGTNANITKGYGTGNEGQYNIAISGDVNSITKFAHKSQAKSYGDISNWLMPPCAWFEIYQCANFTGNLDNWICPSGVGAFIFALNTKVTGNPWLNGLPATLYKVDCVGSRLSGDLSAASLADLSSQSMVFDNNKFTKMPRGALRQNINYSFASNVCSLDEMNDFLEFLDNYFTGGIVPAVNGNYVFTGDGMDMPTGGSSNAHIASLSAKFIAAGKTLTLTVNNYTIAYEDHGTKAQVPLTTYIGGDNETCHPSVVNCGSAWNGYQYWMANTPMPQSNEDPSIWASVDGLTNWIIPLGVTNPIIARPAGDPTLNYNADVNLYYEGGLMYLIWKQTISGASKTMLTSSADGWATHSEPVIIADPADDQGDTSEQASPSLIKIGAIYYIYYVTLTPGNYHIRRRSCATINGNYTSAEDVVLSKISGRGWWHLSVLNIDNVIWLAVSVPAVDNANSYGPYIVLAKSADGVTFTRDADTLPTICGTETWENRDALYRPSMVYVGTQLVVYYGYKTPAHKWATARVNVYLI